jgi:hypothetical protein
MANDIIFIGEADQQWEKLRLRFPTAKRASSLEVARNKAFTKMFWVVWPDIEVAEHFDFSYEATEWDSKYVHVFKNGVEYDGICLINKRARVSRNEAKFRFFTAKKEVDIVASNPLPNPFDIVFISYNETTADVNYQALLKIAPRAKRVHGVNGIHQAHIAAAQQCGTDLFWAVDADAVIVDNFDFSYQVPRWDYDCVHVWRSSNPINDLEYGYGGVKLLPRQLTIDVDVNSADMSTSISNKFKALPQVSNITAFNTDEFSTWRSAFRECAKLSSSVIRGQVDEETDARLRVWCSVGRSRAYGKYAISGATAGSEYGAVHKSSNELGKINDYNWLYTQFLEATHES